MSCCFTRSGLALLASILLSATTSGTRGGAGVVDRLAASAASAPSSAATTMIATSVTCAPRARISVNAAWPGVSMKVTVRPSGAVAW